MNIIYSWISEYLLLVYLSKIFTKSQKTPAKALHYTLLLTNLCAIYPIYKN